MPWKDLHQRINARISSLPVADRQRYEHVRDIIMRESAYADNVNVADDMRHNKLIAIASSNRMKQLTALHDAMSMLNHNGYSYEHMRRDIMQSTAIADDVNASRHDVKLATQERSHKLHVLELLENYTPQPAPQPSRQASNATRMNDVKQSRTTVNRSTEKAINVKTATTENLASMMNSIRKNMKKHLKTTADVGHANRDFFAGILRRKDEE
jgi:hypothetical protein